MGTSKARFSRGGGRFSTPIQAATRRAVVELLEARQLLSTTYYVSNTNSSDSNPGTSASAPWANVAKVNATTFQPGDTVLFQYGSEWHDQLLATADGTATAPVTYAAYGNASLPRPIFEGSDYIAQSAFTSIGNSVYTFPVSAVPGGVVNWVYLNHVSMLASTSGGSSLPANGFADDGTTVTVNTNGIDPRSTANVISVGDKAFSNGESAAQGAIASNGHSFVTFTNLIARETALTPNGQFSLSSANLVSSYAVRLQGGTNVTLNNVEADYGGKHDIGAINTDQFVANNVLANGGINGVSGNTVGFGQETSLVSFGDTAQNLVNTWNSPTVTNYPGGQPAFLSHGDPGSIATLNVNNLSAFTGELAIQTNTNETVNVRGGFVHNSDATFGDAAGAHVLVDGLTLSGNYTYLQVNGDATVENSFISNANQGAIQVRGANNLIRFNTLNAYFYSSDIALQNGTTNDTIYGNLFTGTATGIDGSGGSSYTADYDFFDSTQGTPAFPSGTEAHRVVGDPKFVSTTAGDYSLQSTSPAINVVPTSVVNPALDHDIRSDARPSGNIYDAGAYEYQSVLHQPTIATAAAASPSTVTGTTTNLSVLGASPDGEGTLLYTWAATTLPAGAAAPTYTANGTNAAKNTTATFAKAGAYTFTVTVGNGQYSTTSSVNVTVNQTSQGLTITPSQYFVSTGTTKQFTASVNDQFGNPIAGPTITYSIQSGGGSISGTGLFTPPGTTGTTIIKAASGGVSATATANVVPPNQAPTVATPASSNPNPVTGTTAQLSVVGADDNGEGNLTYAWSQTGTYPAGVAFSANGTNAAKTTTATFTANGNYNFLVTITDQGGLTTTSSVTVTVNTFVPITLDGTKDGRYGSPVSVQTVATNYGNGNLGAPAAPYSQLAAAYGVIDQQDGQFDLFLAGSVNLTNAHLSVLIDSVAGQGPANLSQLQNLSPWGGNGNSFYSTILDTGFRPDHIFTQAFGGGTSLSYFNFDNGTTDNNNTADPANGIITSSGNIPYFQEKLNNAASSAIVSPGQASSVTTGAEFAFSLSGLGYTTAAFNAGQSIGVMAVITYGSFYQYTNQWLAPLNPAASVASNNYFPIDLSNASQFPGNQFFSVGVPAGYQGPSVASAPAVNPNPVTGSTAALSVLGSDPAGESGLTYTWSTTGGPAAVSFSANATNAAKNTTATFTANGTYNFLVTIKDPSGLTTTGTVTATVTGAGTGTNQAPTVQTPAAASPATVAGTTTALSVLGADDGGEANLTYTWATTGTPPAAVTFSANNTNAAKADTATFTKAGTYGFVVTIRDAQGLTTTSSVNVTVNQTPTTVTVTPASVSLAAGATQQFAAAVKDQFGAAIASPAVTWSVPSGTGTITAAGLYTAGSAAGSATVKAASGSASGTAAVTVSATNAAPTVQTAAAATPSPVTGTTTALSVLGADDGGEANLTYTWATTGTPPAAVAFSANATNAAKATTATFTKAGSYSFTVTIKDAGGLTVTSSVTVAVNQTPTTLTLAPSAVTVAPNGTQQFTATVKDQFAAAIASPAVTWSISAGTGTVSTSGLYTAPAAAGSATVKAVSGAASGTAAVTVSATNAAPTVATAAKATPSPVTGTTTALSVLGADDGGEANLTYTWATTGTPPAAVAFSANATNAAKATTATFTKAGSYSFTVTIKDSGGLTVTSSVTVAVNQTVTHVTVSPATSSVPTGVMQQFAAAVTDQFNAAIASPAVTWAVTAGTGTITATGLYTAPAAAGSATVQATSGGVSGTASVTVTATAPGGGVTVDGTLDAKYGSPIVVQSQATNFGNGNYTGPYGSGASAPYSQLSAGYAYIDKANNQFDLFIAGSLNLSNAHLDLLLDSVPGAGVANLSSLTNVGPYGTSFPTVVLDNGFRPDHIFSFAYGGGTSVDYVNLDNATASDVGFVQSDPSQGTVTENVGGVPAYSERVNNAQQANVIAAGAGGSVTTGIEFSFSLSGLGYTTANYNAGLPIGVQAIITYGSHTIGTNQILAPYTPSQTELNRDGGIYTFLGGGNFDFSNNTRFAGNQFFSAPTPPITVDGTLDPRYGTADVVQTQATNFGNANYTGPYGNGASAPYSQLSAGYTVIDQAHNQLDLFIAGSLNLSNAHLDLLIDSVPGAGVANLSSLTNIGAYGTSFPTITLDAGFRPDHIFSFAYGGGTSANYVNLDTGGSSFVQFNQSDPSQGTVTENVAGVPAYQMAVNNAQQANVIAAGAGSSVTTGIEFAFNLAGLGYTAAAYAAGTPVNVTALITYGSHTIGTNQILGGYTPNQAELNRDGGIYTFLGGGNFDFSNQTRFAGSQYFTAQTTPIYAVAVAGTAVAGFTSDASYVTGNTQVGTTTDAVDTSNVNNGAPTSLYQTERYGPSFTETFGGFVAGSTHTVTLALAETFWTGPNQRVFSVAANGVAKLTNFDPFAAAGGKDRAINQTFTAVADPNGSIALAFTSSVDQAKVCGIEIF